MSAKLTLVGVAELRAELRKFPAHLTGEATHLVEGEANGAAVQVKRNYPVRDGDLRDGVFVESKHGPVVARAYVVSSAKHAYMYENGTEVRHTRTGKSSGSMPPAPPGRAFIPVLIRARRALEQALVALLVRNGLTVSGHGG